MPSKKRARMEERISMHQAPPGEAAPAFYENPEPGTGKRRDDPTLILRKIDFGPGVDLTGMRDLAAQPIPAEDLEGS
jgi:hypothetical protein